MSIDLLRALTPQVVGVLTKRFRDFAAAEDAVQEALLRAWERSEKGEEIDSLEGWVTTVALNLARSGLRRLRSERRARSRLAGSAVGAPPTADRVDVDRALADLPRRQREVAVLRYYLQMSIREVASVLELEEGTVKSTLFRARAALAQALGIDENEEANDRGSR